MKFKAKIEYNFIQSREAKLFGDKNIKYAEVEFTFQDILCNPLFTERELIIPWLKAGNIPEVID
jgi:hypothetical protein